jgi:hypothetical protein
LCERAAGILPAGREAIAQERNNTADASHDLALPATLAAR